MGISAGCTVSATTSTGCGAGRTASSLPHPANVRNTAGAITDHELHERTVTRIAHLQRNGNSQSAQAFPAEKSDSAHRSPRHLHVPDGSGYVRSARQAIG